MVVFRSIVFYIKEEKTYVGRKQGFENNFYIALPFKNFYLRHLCWYGVANHPTPFDPCLQKMNPKQFNLKEKHQYALFCLQ